MKAIFSDNEKIMMKKKNYNLYLVIIILFLAGYMAFPQGKNDDEQRGVSLIEKNTSQSKGRKCALIIGINEYECISALKNPVTDAKAVEAILLNKFGYKSEDMITFYDKEATSKNIYDKLEEYLEEKGLKEEDSLFVFFSGHGKEKYWLPVDFGTDLKNEENKNESGIKISKRDIKKYLARFKAKHIFIVDDSCFAGKSFSFLYRESDPRIYDKKSRQVLVSGRKWVRDDNVIDGKDDGHSPFAKSFLKVLENNWTEFTAEILIDQVLVDFRTDFNQKPEGGFLDYVGDEGGQFVFTPEYTPKELKWAQEVNRLLNQKDNLKTETMRRYLFDNCRLFIDKNPPPTNRLHKPYEQLNALRDELEEAIKITKKLKDNYDSWKKMDKKEEKIKELKIFLKNFEEAPVDEDLESMKKVVVGYIDKMFNADYDNLKKSIIDALISRNKTERLTVNFLKMYRGIKHIESKVEEIKKYFNENFKINPLHFAIGWGDVPISSSLVDFDNNRSVNFEIGYHLKLYLLGDVFLLTPFFINIYQLGGKESFELVRKNYPLLVKVGKTSMVGFGIKFGSILLFGNKGKVHYKMDAALSFAYCRNYFNIEEITNQSDNTTLDFIEINHKNFHDIFYIGFEYFIEIKKWLYVGFRYIGTKMGSKKSKSLFKYEININPETKANFTFPANFSGIVSFGIKFYL